MQGEQVEPIFVFFPCEEMNTAVGVYSKTLYEASEFLGHFFSTQSKLGYAHLLVWLCDPTQRWVSRYCAEKNGLLSTKAPDVCIVIFVAQIVVFAHRTARCEGLSAPGKVYHCKGGHIQTEKATEEHLLSDVDKQFTVPTYTHVMCSCTFRTRNRR